MESRWPGESGFCGLLGGGAYNTGRLDRALRHSRPSAIAYTASQTTDRQGPMIQLLHADVLDAHAGALLLTIDGQAKGLRGNLAHAFQRRWPEAYEDFESQLRFPVPLGTAVRVDADTDCPWRTILFVSTLHHVETLDTAGKLAVIQRALGSALHIAARTSLRTLATAPMKGGWRLTTPEAYHTMYETWLGSPLHRMGGALLVCCLDATEYQSLVDEHQRLVARRI